LNFLVLQHFQPTQMYLN